MSVDPIRLSSPKVGIVQVGSLRNGRGITTSGRDPDEFRRGTATSPTKVRFVCGARSNDPCTIGSPDRVLIQCGHVREPLRGPSPVSTYAIDVTTILIIGPGGEGDPLSVW